jgi:hypothetical protein
LKLSALATERQSLPHNYNPGYFGDGSNAYVDMSDNFHKRNVDGQNISPVVVSLDRPSAPD